MAACECGCGGEANNRFINGHNRWKNPGTPRYIAEDRGHETPCWIWQGSMISGYGELTAGGRHVLAHRHHWSEANGPIPDEMPLDHLCRVPACVNPEHLEPVTWAENVQRGSAAKLTLDQVREVRASTEGTVALARRLGVERGAIYKVRSGKSWKDVA